MGVKVWDDRNEQEISIGRPSKLNQAVQDRICSIIEQTGCSLEGAAAVCGISHDNLKYWKRRARADGEDSVYYQFYEAVGIAQRKSEPPLAAVMAQAARKGDWRAAHAMLKSRFPETWGDQITIVKKFADMSDEELDEYLAAQLTRITEDEADFAAFDQPGGGDGPEDEDRPGPPALAPGDREPGPD